MGGMFTVSFQMWMQSTVAPPQPMTMDIDKDEPHPKDVKSSLSIKKKDKRKAKASETLTTGRGGRRDPQPASPACRKHLSQSWSSPSHGIWQGNGDSSGRASCAYWYAKKQETWNGMSTYQERKWENEAARGTLTPQGQKTGWGMLSEKEKGARIRTVLV